MLIYRAINEKEISTEKGADFLQVPMVEILENYGPLEVRH